MLSFKNVSLLIDENSILKDCSFDVFPQEIVAILGASGAGKSSIFRCLTGEIKPTTGSISLDNFTLENLSLKSLQKYRRQIGIVFQNFCLLREKTVYENIAYALEVCGESDEIEIKVPEILATVGMWDKRNRFPRECSGGEIQRVAIARALVHNPKILIADEPTGNLDPKNSREITELFKKINKEKQLTIIFATHDPIIFDTLSPRVIRLEGGEILFDTKKCDKRKAFAGIV
jgi:cell division transport system ATP-binding protein